MEWNSYDRFFYWLSEKKGFSNDAKKMRAEFWRFGIENTIFARPDLANEQYFDKLQSQLPELSDFDSIYNVLTSNNEFDGGRFVLRNRNKNGDWSSNTKDKIYLRKQDGNDKQRPVYEALYKILFPNIEPERYKFDSNYPIRTSIRSFVEDEDRNFQCSHVFERSLNPMAYMAVWNFALTPKMFDPLTGHETRGVDNVIFSILFQGVVCRLQEACIKKYNEFINEKKDIIASFITKHVDWENHILNQFKLIKEVEFIHDNEKEANHAIESENRERIEWLKQIYPVELSEEIVAKSNESIEAAYKFVCANILHVSPEFRILGGGYELPTDVNQKAWLEKHPDIVMIQFDNK